jgi:Na+/phosphate symporter
VRRLIAHVISAVAYVSSQSVNPLVVGPNVTTRSDARIFSSDGNATMKELAKSSGLFSSTCGALLTRMLNTVPRNVTLTYVIEPLPVKPADLTLMRNNNGTFSLSGNVRVSAYFCAALLYW